MHAAQGLEAKLIIFNGEVAEMDNLPLTAEQKKMFCQTDAEYTFKLWLRGPQHPEILVEPEPSNGHGPSGIWARRWIDLRQPAVARVAVPAGSGRRSPNQLLATPAQ